MTYFARADAFDARQVVCTEEQVVINGTVQTARAGHWVARRAGQTSIWTDDDFRKRFIEVER